MVQEKMTQSIQKFSRLSALIPMLGICLITPNGAVANEVTSISAQPTHSITQQPSQVESVEAVPHDDKNTSLVAQVMNVTAPTSTIAKDAVVDEADEPYQWRYALEDAKANKWEGLGAFAGITALGVYSWDWGGSSFHFNNENWFGKNTVSGGSDKLGHAFTSYALTNAFAERLQEKGRSPARAAMSAGLMTTALMLYVEAFDGVSGDHGFSYEDVLMNTLGTGFAYLRQTNPRLKSLVDYRMEYKPSGYKGFRPLSDYEGQKYLLALKFSGMKSLKDTPLKYFELQTGYYSRGFSKQARADGKTRTQQGFVGIGVNLTELLFGTYDRDENKYKKWGRFAFEHVQVPYTYVRSTIE
jgi:uncharacterized protein YfiM (DUF2279 family)